MADDRNRASEGSEPAPENPAPPPPNAQPDPPFAPDLDLIGDLERGQRAALDERSS
jgi:hypothetical protein